MLCTMLPYVGTQGKLKWLFLEPIAAWQLVRLTNENVKWGGGGQARESRGVPKVNSTCLGLSQRTKTEISTTSESTPAIRHVMFI